MDSQLVGREQISSAVDALRKYLNKIGERQKNLLNPVEQENIHLQFSLKKVSLKKKLLRIQLPHSLVDETTSVCLFVRDEDRNNRDYSVTVDKLKEELDSAGVKQRIEIVPLKQLKLEYKEYESKRSLLTLYDTFLADERIIRLLPPQLGKHFYVRKRHPVQVDVTRTHALKKEIDRALCTTQCLFAGRGSSGQVTVARMSQSTEEVVDNVVAAIQRLSSSVAGSVMNIRSLHLKTQDAVSLPIYISTGSKDDIKFETTKQKKIRVEPEDVTTITEGKVMVTKRGSVRVFATNGAEVKAEAVATKKTPSKKTPSKTARQQRKRKNVPILVPALTVVDEGLLDSEVKEEHDEESPVLKKSKLTGDAVKQKNNKINTKKVVDEVQSKIKQKPKKSAVVVDLKVEEVKEEEATENVNPKRSSKTEKARKPVKTVNRKRVLDSEPLKKKRKV